MKLDGIKAILAGASKLAKDVFQFEQHLREAEKHLQKEGIHLVKPWCRPGGWASGHRFDLDDRWIRYQYAYGRSFRVLRSDVQTVTIVPAGRGTARVQLIGHGTVLAETPDMPVPWAEQAQDWLLSVLGH